MHILSPILKTSLNSNAGPKISLKNKRIQKGQSLVSLEPGIELEISYATLETHTVTVSGIFLTASTISVVLKGGRLADFLNASL